MLNTEMEQRIEELLRQMTLKEKVALLAGKDNWRTVPIPRLGIPSVTMTDGPHGVRSTPPEDGRLSGPATSFPTGVSMAASWDPELVERVGAALGDETHAMGCDILLGPCVNIVRTPLAGRNFESYSEDPHLAGRIGVAWVKGLQSRGVGASLKHYACNNQEIERGRGNSVVDERTLREIYLAQFEAVVKEAHPWTVMCSYNRINGDYASEHTYLLNTILKGEWGFEGAVISDWGANHTITASVQGGLDVEMPGPARYYGDLLEAAVNNWQIDEATIDAAVRRVLRLVMRCGKFDGPTPSGAVNTSEHQHLAREVAEASITLLKNADAVLPLAAERLTSVAVIGPNAAEARIGGGGSSYLLPPYRVSPLEGLRARLGAEKVHYTQGCANYTEPPVLQSLYLRLPSGAGEGLLGEYFNGNALSAQPDAVRTDMQLDFWMLQPPAEISREAFAVRWTGKITVPEGGPYTLVLRGLGAGRLYVDGRLAMEMQPLANDPWRSSMGQATVALESGQPHDLRIEYHKSPQEERGALFLMAAPALDEAAAIAQAVELARQADVALIFGGMPTSYESEGHDRPDMHLPGRQNDLIRAVAAVNPRTVVVLNCGSPVEIPWLDAVAGVVLAYYPGQEAGHALANVLLGDVNPSGKLPVTFPKRLEDNPSFINYPGAREVLYGEGIFVGYRYYDKKDVDPLFPFGFGLSYTTFAYSDLCVPSTLKRGEPLRVAVTVTNTGERFGKEVVQLYVRDPQSSLVRPIKELKGFRKVALAPGESAVVEFALDERALAFYDPYCKQWVVEPGEFEVLVGSSSRDSRVCARFTLEA